MKIIGDSIYLKLLTPEDVTLDYVNWLNDLEVNQYLESRFKKHTLHGVRKYVKEINSTGENYLFGIYNKENNKHIGNIKIGNINKIHKFCDVGLMIGDRTMWGKGKGSESIKLVTQYAFDRLKLNKIIAGIYANNIGSYKAFIKCGYSEIGRMKRHYISRGGYVDKIIVEKLRL